MDDLIAGVLAGDRTAMGRAITLGGVDPAR